ncbi:NAD(P)-binding protein [Lyophyllum atratum]|nr:NAD(P)-binding protein [Lyophyllum atratum]
MTPTRNGPTIDLDNVPLHGGVLIKMLVLSIDQRCGKIFIHGAECRFKHKFTIGQPIPSFGVGVVIPSEDLAFHAGDHLYGYYEFQEYDVIKDVSSLRLIKDEEKLPWSLYVGILGMPVYGWKEYAKPTKGDVVFVTTGAGIVQSAELVIQLAKRDGLKVIASAGFDDKVKSMKDIGADIAFNYKTTGTRQILEKEGPVNIYWDHVGGETLEIALDFAARHARFIECGMILNLWNICIKEIHLFGFMVSSLQEKHRSNFEETDSGDGCSWRFRYLEDVTEGLEHAGEAILAVQKGENMGKSVILVAND